MALKDLVLEAKIAAKKVVRSTTEKYTVRDRSQILPFSTRNATRISNAEVKDSMNPDGIIQDIIKEVDDLARSGEYVLCKKIPKGSYNTVINYFKKKNFFVVTDDKNLAY